MEVTKAIQEVFHDCELLILKQYHPPLYKNTSNILRINIKNKWNAYLEFEDSSESKGQFLTSYNSPGKHLVFQNYDVNNVEDMLIIRGIVEDMLTTMHKFEELDNSSMNIKGYVNRQRDVKLNQLV